MENVNNPILDSYLLKLPLHSYRCFLLQRKEEKRKRNPPTGDRQREELPITPPTVVKEGKRTLSPHSIKGKTKSTKKCKGHVRLQGRRFFFWRTLDSIYGEEEKFDRARVCEAYLRKFAFFLALLSSRQFETRASSTTE